MRLFIAAELPGDVKQELIKAQKTISKSSAQITLTKDFHLTYAFLGEVDEKDVPKLIEQLSSVAIEEIETSLAGVGFFPDENFVRVVWVGLSNEKLILNQQRRIAQAINYNDERFKAHITLCRVKRFDKSVIEYGKRINLKDMKFKIKGFSLIQSTLTNDGPIYKVIKTFY